MINQELRHKVKTAHISVFDHSFLTSFYGFVTKRATQESTLKPRTTPEEETGGEKEASATVKKRDKNLWDDEEKYYTLLIKLARLWAPFYDIVLLVSFAFGGESGLRRKVVDFANARIGSKILDVATGTGKQAFAFAAKGHNVVGVDLSKGMLNVALKKNKYKNLRFEIADATNLPFNKNSFDVSSVSFALHDMIPIVREKTIEEVVRVTKPRGTIVIVDYAWPKKQIRRFLFYNVFKLWEPYYTEFVKFDLETLLKKSGIKIQEEQIVSYGWARILKGTKAADTYA